jgi:hypothetical protein
MLDWRKASRLRVDVVRHRKSSFETTIESVKSGFSRESLVFARSGVFAKLISETRAHARGHSRGRDVCQLSSS